MRPVIFSSQQFCPSHAQPLPSFSGQGFVEFALKLLHLQPESIGGGVVQGSLLLQLLFNLPQLLGTPNVCNHLITSNNLLSSCITYSTGPGSGAFAGASAATPPTAMPHPRPRAAGVSPPAIPSRRRPPQSALWSTPRRFLFVKGRQVSASLCASSSGVKRERFTSHPERDESGRRALKLSVKRSLALSASSNTAWHRLRRSCHRRTCFGSSSCAFRAAFAAKEDSHALPASTSARGAGNMDSTAGSGATSFGSSINAAGVTRTGSVVEAPESNEPYYLLHTNLY